jgi:GPH family glycoside/pentoside/hexuronide:cation symporter
VQPDAQLPEPERRLGALEKLVYGMGDHSVNLSLSALSIIFFYFLTDVAGMRPSLAGLAILLARCFDAISDPVIGHFSDTRTWDAGRRRPFFLIGVLPFALCFALIWRTPFDPDDGQAAMFVYYSVVSMALSLATTTLSVPYLALLPEMAHDYHERTSLNAYRAGCAVSGTLFAVGMRGLADSWGGDPDAYSATGAIFGVWLLLPWLPAFRVSFERRDVSVPPAVPLLQGAVEVATHRNFLRLSGLFIAARIAVDLGAAALSYYTAYWLGRPGDLVPCMLILLVSSIVSLPIWLSIGHHVDKHRMFIAGAGFWVVLLCVLFFVPQDVPRGALFALIAISGFGYCAADLAPWSMIGEVIDEDELTTGQRREGVYNGFFTFMRKIAGASGVAAMGVGFEAAGYVAEQPQTDDALLAIRVATALAPAFFLAVAIGFALGYPLTRREHERIREELDARDRAEG